MTQTLYSHSEKKGGCCCFKSCGCGCLILIILLVLGSAAAFYFAPNLAPQGIIGKTIKLAYTQGLRDQIKAQMAGLTEAEKERHLQKADLAIDALSQKTNEEQLLIFQEALKMGINSQNGKITPPDEIQNLSRFLQEQNIQFGP